MKKFDTALAAYVAVCQKALDERHAEWPALGLTVPTLSVDPGGRKYLRIVKSCGISRNVECFVERATGLIWKAAGWKRPCLNFPRGTIYQDAA